MPFPPGLGARTNPALAVALAAVILVAGRGGVAAGESAADEGGGSPDPGARPVPSVSPAAPAVEPFPPPACAFPDPESIPRLDAVVVVPKFGEFRVRFYPDDAPNHVAHFLTLAAEGYYDGMAFHRVIPDYLIQVGDPSSRDEDPRNDGTGGPGYSLPPEPNGRTHRRGSFSMAWRGDEPGTAGSQWFVTLSDLPALDGRATLIGEVVEGMDVVDRISQVSTHRNRNPLRRVVIETIRLVEGG